MDFSPNWDPPPVTCTIEDVLERQGKLKSIWLMENDISDEDYYPVFHHGTMPLTDKMVKKLVASLGGTEEFWWNRWKLWKYGWKYESQ